MYFCIAPCSLAHGTTPKNMRKKVSHISLFTQEETTWGCVRGGCVDVVVKLADICILLETCVLFRTLARFSPLAHGKPLARDELFVPTPPHQREAESFKKMLPRHDLFETWLGSPKIQTAAYDPERGCSLGIQLLEKPLGFPTYSDPLISFGFQRILWANKNPQTIGPTRRKDKGLTSSFFIRRAHYVDCTCDRVPACGVHHGPRLQRRGAHRRDDPGLDPRKIEVGFAIGEASFFKKTIAVVRFFFFGGGVLEVF